MSTNTQSHGVFVCLNNNRIYEKDSIEFFTAMETKIIIPLLLEGSSSWKTWLMKEFAKTEYKNFAYINFEDNQQLKTLFLNDFDILRILLAIQNKLIPMKFWQENVDRIIEFNDKKLLVGSGSVSKIQMVETADRIYEEFNTRRKVDEAKQSDRDDWDELKSLRMI